jgi:hypothetical protein
MIIRTQNLLFRTVKYHPRWPSEVFISLDEART